MDDLISIFVERLAAAGVDYMVTGSVAAMVYGEPRLTHDVDLVVALPVAQIRAFVAAFPGEEFYCAPEEVIRVEAARHQRGHFNVIHHETGLSSDAIDQAALQGKITEAGLTAAWGDVGDPNAER